jgi:S-adenosylmethionine:tRNA ribosyltransferase-isomerase
MRLEDFEFELPDELIAQAPLPERDASRLLVLDRRSSAIAHRRFRDLPLLLRGGDLLVLNDTRVIPARLIGQKVPTGGRAELLLIRPAGHLGPAAALAASADAGEWICLGQASKGFRSGTRLEFGGGLAAEIIEDRGGGELRVRFAAREGGGVSLAEILGRVGRLPLPPYIQREPTPLDRERYQTIFARVPGSVAAPTAALHFTEQVLSELEARGVRSASVTLDVGPGTFLPVREDIATHRMHAERYDVPEATAAAIERTRADGHRVVAVGTTVVRTLEAASDPATGRVRPGPGDTRLFITPGFQFRQVDALLTNFHLPRSTLLMLVSAFAGREPTLAAYREAVKQRYRFFSYGDAMFISDGVT